MRNYKISLIFPLIISFFQVTFNGQIKEVKDIDFYMIDTTEKCLLTEDLFNTIDLVKKDIKSLLKENETNDNCVLALLDSLADRFIRTSDTIYINCLEIIANVSDGYLSEYFPFLCQNLYHNNFKGFFNYLYMKSENDEKVLEMLFVEGVSYEIEERKNKNRVMNYLYDQMNANNFHGEKRSYFDYLMLRVNNFLNNNK